MENKEKFLKLAKVAEITSLGETSIKRLINKGQFPKPIKLSARRNAWLEHEVHDWMKKKIENSRPSREV